MEWKPIETAPKDGTWVLGYTKRKIHGWRSSNETGSMFCCRYWPDEKVTDTIPWFSNMDGFPQPTHWMPLPEPPATT